MMVFFPFDPDRPGNGGSSFVFSQSADGEAQFRRWLKQEKAERTQLDFAKLVALNSVPTFSPEIIRLAFERALILMHDCYACLSTNFRCELEAHLRARMRDMVLAAMGAPAASVERTIEFFVEYLLSPASDAQAAIKPLVQALQLPPNQGWDILATWVGIAIYECETIALRPMMRAFATWLGGAAPSERLCRADKEMVRWMKHSILGHAALGHAGETRNNLIGIERAYREAHEAMAFQGCVRRFVAFLKAAPQYYLRVGDVIGRLEHGVCIWKQYLGRYNGDSLPYRELSELCEVLR